MDTTLERILTLIPQNENGRFVRGAASEFSKKIGIAPNLPAEWKAGRNKSYMTKLYEISNAKFENRIKSGRLKPLDF